MGLRSSTTSDEAFQHLKPQLVITNSVFKLKMAGDNFWNLDFSTFFEKLQNVYPVAANPDQIDKYGYDFWSQRPPKPPNPVQTSSPQKSYIPVSRTLQHISARCDGDQSGPLPTQIVLFPTNALTHFYTQHNHCILYSCYQSLYPLVQHYRYHHSDILSTFWISTVQRRSAIWFPTIP